MREPRRSLRCGRWLSPTRSSYTNRCWSIRTAKHGKKKGSLPRLIGISGGLHEGGILIIIDNHISQRSQVGRVRNQALEPSIECIRRRRTLDMVLQNRFQLRAASSLRRRRWGRWSPAPRSRVHPLTLSVLGLFLLLQTLRAPSNATVEILSLRTRECHAAVLEDRRLTSRSQGPVLKCRWAGFYYST